MKGALQNPGEEDSTQGNAKVRPSFFTFWSPPTAAQLSIEAVPPTVAEGKEVLLLAPNVSQDLFGYNWYKGERVDANYRIRGYVIETGVSNTGPAYSGRETVYPNGSLLIQSVTPNDTGSYTLHIIDTNLTSEEVLGRFDVQGE
ncbi:Carcinoembryonic antigen-related cell adhesion molecule 8 [Plecturocebus cupreus]